MLPVLDSVLLFAFSIPVVMYYRILPVEGTPYWLFGVLFFLVSVNCVVSIFPDILGIYRKYFGAIKTLILVSVLGIALAGPVVTAMFDRAKTAPVYGVHDIILQQEAAMRYLIVGKNPYKETYFGTFVEDFNYGEIGNPDAVNPALYHFVMPPWYLLFPFLFYYTSIPVVGFFDGRMALLFTMGLLLWFLWHLFRDKHLARVAIVLTALSPAVVQYFVEGRSDVFALSWLVGALVYLSRKRYILSGILLALAMLSKQTIWFAVPFYGVYLWTKLGKSKEVFWKTLATVFAVSSVIVLPFLVWDARAFVDSVILYLTGNTQNSYPVSGYGLGMVLFEFGFIKDTHAYYPFIFWQILLAGPVLLWCLSFLRKKQTLSALMLSYAVFLTVYWYSSRYFNNSHLGYLSMLYVLAGLKAVDEGNI